MIVRELLTVLDIDLKDESFKKARTAFDSLVKLSGAVVAATGVLTVGLLSLVKSTADAGDRARDAAIATGLEIETYQELGFAAQQSGASLDVLKVGLRNVQIQAANAAKGGKESGAVFRKLGVDVKGTDGKIRPTEELFKDLATAIKAVENPTERMSLANGIFGKSVSMLLPLLLEGGDGIEALQARARELGFVFDQRAADASDAFNDSLAELQIAAGGVARRLGVLLMPTVKRAVDALTKWIVVNRKLVDPVLRNVADAVVSVFEKILSLTQAVIYNSRFLLTMAGVIVTFLTPGVLALASAWLAANAAQIAMVATTALVIAGFVALAALIALVIEDVFTFVDGGESFIGDLIDAFLNGPKASDSWIVKMLREILRWINDAIQATEVFFTGFFKEALELGGIGAAITEALGSAVDYWVNKLTAFIKAALDGVFKLAGVLKFIPGVGPIFQGLTTGADTGRTAKMLSDFSGFSDGRPSVTAAPASRTWPINSPPLAIYPSPEMAGFNQTVNVQVDASGADPQEVGQRTAEAVSRKMADERREILRQVSTVVKR